MQHCQIIVKKTLPIRLKIVNVSTLVRYFKRKSKNVPTVIINYKRIKNNLNFVIFRLIKLQILFIVK